jgi:hypothetical protein
MLRSLELKGVGPVRGLSASFGERLNVLTGDNGLGKSFLLDVCFWALTGTWPGGRTALPAPNGKKDKPAISYEIEGNSGKPKEKTAHFDFHSQTWSKPAGRPVMPGLVVYAAVDGGFAVWDPARNYWRDPLSGIKEGDEQPRAYQFSPETLANGLRDGERVLCNGLIQDWVNWFYEYSSSSSSSSSSTSSAGSGNPSTSRSTSGGGKRSTSESRFSSSTSSGVSSSTSSSVSRARDINPFGYLEAVVSLLSHPLEPMTCGEPRRVYVDQPRKYPVLAMPYGEVPYPHWSAGVRRVISFAYLLVWAWYEHVQAAQLRGEDPTDRLILIVDEIEAHLHPKWQRTILPALLQVTRKLQDQIGVQVFAATHSPLILASLEPHFDREKDKLFWFDLQEQTVHFRDYPWAIQGDVVGWLTSEIFGPRQARSREGENAVEAAEAFMRGDFGGLPDGLKSKDDIQRALKRSLPGLDPFWPRWIVEVKP